MSNTSDFVVSHTHIICFLPGLSQVDKDDVIESTLMAQLSAAQVNHHPYKNASAWYQRYIQTLTAERWTLQSESSWSQVPQELIRVSPDITFAQVLQMSKGITAEASLRLAQAFLYLKGPNPVGLDIESNGLSGSGGSFQLLICSKSEGETVANLYPLIFETTEPMTSVLFQQFDDPHAYTFKYMSDPAVLVLNTKECEPVRQTVKYKLGGCERNMVTYLPL